MTIVVERLSIPARRSEYPAVPFSVVGVALATTAVLLSTAGRYGFHRDELYFLDCARHLQWGFTDQPPLTSLLVRLSVLLFGDGSPFGIRVVPGLAAGVTVVLVALVARELGGGPVAQRVAATVVALSPFVLMAMHRMTTSAVNIAVEIALSLLFLRILRTRDASVWVAIGVVAGIGLENKDLVLLTVISWLVAIVLTGQRDILLRRWFVAGCAVAFLLCLPNLVWQATHGWPQLVMAQRISAVEGGQARWSLLPFQVLVANPVLVPITIAGIVFVVRAGSRRPARTLGWAGLAVVGIVLVTGGKVHYAAPVTLTMMGAGGVATEAWLSRGPRRRRRWAVGLLMVLAAVLAIPLSLPLLPARSLLHSPVRAINYGAGETAGWPQLVEQVAAAYHALPAKQRRRAVLYADTYGEAGALDLYGKRRGLPSAYSADLSYADWGPPPEVSHVAVVVGRATSLRHACSTSTLLGRVGGVLTQLNGEYGSPIWLCGGIGSWHAVWPDLRRYYPDTVKGGNRRGATG